MTRLSALQVIDISNIYKTPCLRDKVRSRSLGNANTIDSKSKSDNDCYSFVDNPLHVRELEPIKVVKIKSSDAQMSHVYREKNQIKIEDQMFLKCLDADTSNKIDSGGKYEVDFAEKFRKRSGNDFDYEKRLEAALADSDDSGKEQKKKTKISHLMQLNTIEVEGFTLLELLEPKMESPIKESPQPKDSPSEDGFDPLRKQACFSELADELKQIVAKDPNAIKLVDQITLLVDEVVRDSTMKKKQLKHVEAFANSYSLSASRNTDPNNNSTVFDSMMNMLEDIYANEDISNTVKVYQNFRESNLHFCFMFASPLVIFKQSLGNPVLKTIPWEIEYNNDLNRIKRTLRNANCNIGFLSSKASTTNFVEVMKKNPMILHFCGHGVDNSRSMRMASTSEDNVEKYYLLFEDYLIRGELVTCGLLESMLNSAYSFSTRGLKNKLEFVFVASCHSEIMAKVFLTAGASHVLCVNKDERISDEICQEFTELYYRAFFFENLTFCEAFESAKTKIAAGMFFNGEEAKFKMLLPPRYDGPHRCTRFISKPDQNAKFTDYTPVPTFAMPRFTHDCFVGRNKEMYEILDTLHYNRFVTVKGTIGIGKSTLIRELGNKMMDRALFADGIIYIDAKRDCSVERAVSILLGNQTISSIIRRKSGNKDFDLQQSLAEIISALSSYEVLVIFDNLDNLASKASSHLRTFFDGLVSNTKGVKILTTLFSKVETIQAGFAEKVYEVGPLSDSASAQLLLKRATRRVFDQEIAQLYQNHPCLVEGRQSLENHFLVKLFGGLPQALLMGASILHNRNLSELCTLLNGGKNHLSLQPLILEAGSHPLVENSITLALEIVEDLGELDNLKALSFFPSGILETDLRQVWGPEYAKHLTTLLSYSLLHRHKQNEEVVYYTLNCFLLDHLTRIISLEEMGEHLGRLSDLFLAKMENYYATIGTFTPSNQFNHFNFEESNIKFFFAKAAEYYQKHLAEDTDPQSAAAKKRVSIKDNKVPPASRNSSITSKPGSRRPHHTQNIRRTHRRRKQRGRGADPEQKLRRPRRPRSPRTSRTQARERAGGPSHGTAPAQTAAGPRERPAEPAVDPKKCEKRAPRAQAERRRGQRGRHQAQDRLRVLDPR